jgi:hypothetical protein
VDFYDNEKKSGPKTTLNELQQIFRRVCLKLDLTDVLLLHDNDQSHTSLRTREAVAKMGWVFFPILLTAQNLHPQTIISLVR